MTSRSLTFQQGQVVYTNLPCELLTKLEFVNKMNDIQNKNATKLILNQNRVNQAVMNFEKGMIYMKI
jgi:hypothetical protein